MVGSWGKYYPLLRRRNRAKLCQEAKEVYFRPELDNFTVLEPVHVDLRPGDLPPGGGDTIELTSMSCGNRISLHDPVSLGHKIMNGNMDIWECFCHRLTQNFEALAALWKPWILKMMDEGRREQFVNYGMIRLVLEFLNEPTDYCLILLFSQF